MDQPASPNLSQTIPQPTPQVVFPTQNNKGKNKKLLLAAGAVLVLMFGLISALVLSRQSLNFFSIH